jgi:hypothetical protein
MRSARAVRFLPIVLSGLFGVGCHTGDSAKCEQAVQTSRQALDRENFSLAQQWREYAWKQCADRSTVEGLDRDLVAKQNQVAAREQAAAQRRAENVQLLKVFLQWVADNHAAPDRASATPACDPPVPNDPQKENSKERLCTATRAAGSHQLTARYWEAQPTLALFSVKLPDVTSCEQIGASKQLKTWQVPATNGATTGRFRCEFTSGPLTGLQAVLSQAVNAELYVFNPGYLDKEPALRPMLDGP